jgi:hypothetical protein
MDGRLTLDQMRDLLKKVTYRRGWRLSLEQHPFEGVWLTVEFSVADAYDQTLRQKQRVRTWFPICFDERTFYANLEFRLERIESHEAREFFLIEGERVFDPHQSYEDIQDQ